MSETETKTVNGTDFIRAYDKEHGPCPASKVLKAAKESGYSFGLSLVYEVRRRDRKKDETAKHIENGEFKVVYKRKKARSSFGSKKQFDAVRDMLVERTLSNHRKQFVELVREIGLVEAKRLIGEIQGQM